MYMAMITDSSLTFKRVWRKHFNYLLRLLLHSVGQYIKLCVAKL